MAGRALPTVTFTMSYTATAPAQSDDDQKPRAPVTTAEQEVPGHGDAERDQHLDGAQPSHRPHDHRQRPNPVGNDERLDPRIQAGHLIATDHILSETTEGPRGQ